MAAVMPAKLKADLLAIRCATARRGGRPCKDDRCVCSMCTTLLERADHLFQVLIDRGAVSPAQRRAIRDWRQALAQGDAEWEAIDNAPPALRAGLEVLLDAEGLSRSCCDDLDRLRWAFRGRSQQPVSKRVVVETVRWVQKHLCPPRRQVRAAGRSRRHA